MFREHIILAAFLLQREVFYTRFKKSVNTFLQFCILALSIPLIQLFIPSSCLVVLVLVIHILFSFLVTKLSHLCFCIRMSMKQHSKTTLNEVHSIFH